MRNRSPLELLPVFLNVKDLPCLVVGGGRIATRKIGKLVQAGAEVSVISPEVTEQVQEWAVNGWLTWIERSYQHEEAAEYVLIFAATNDSQVNAEVAQDARKAGRFVNVIDDAKACSLVMPASMKTDVVQVAISTSGTSPKLAKSLRGYLESDVAHGT